MYQSPTRRNFRTGLAVAAVQAGIGAALLSAFGGGVIRQVFHPTLQANTMTYMAPLPQQPKPIPHATAPTHDSVIAPPSPIPGLAPPGNLVLGPMTPTLPFAGTGGYELPDISITPAKPAYPPVAARPLGDRGSWITTDDYPSRALREGWSGTTRLHVMVGSDGRVEGCTVIASSGHAELDAVACAKVTERARFSPARDSSGAASAGTYDGAIHWRINEVPGD